MGYLVIDDAVSGVKMLFRFFWAGVYLEMPEIHWHVKIVGFVFIQENKSLCVNALNLFWGILEGPSLCPHCVEIGFCRVLEWRILGCSAPCISFAKHCCLPLLLVGKLLFSPALQSRENTLAWPQHSASVTKEIMLPIRNDPRKWESWDCKAAFIATLLAPCPMLLVSPFF